jgi:hypothetical protein
MQNFICGGDKYELGGPKSDVIGLPVSFQDLPEKLEIEGCCLSLRTSFHVSLVCIGKIIEKYNISIPNFLNNVIKDFCEFTSKNNVDLLKYTNEFKFVAEGERKSVVLMCDISNLNVFFDSINTKYNLQIEYPPTHVTLYTLQPNVGIFLTDMGDIKKLSKPISNPIGRSIV